MLLTLLINLGTLLLRPELRGFVSSGWTWLYILSICICAVYIIDVGKRVHRWLNDYKQWLDDFKTEMNRVQQEHKQWCKNSKNDWNAAQTQWRTDLDRQITRQINDAGYSKADLAALLDEGRVRAEEDKRVMRKLDDFIDKASKAFPSVF